MSRHLKCFKASLEAASERADTSVVHAWIPQNKGWKIHAWAEDEQYVFDYCVSRLPIDKKEYYHLRKIQQKNLKRYTRLEAFELMAATGTPGPFDSKLFPKGCEQHTLS